LCQAPGGYPPLPEWQDLAYAKRIHVDIFQPRDLNMWIGADNVRRRAALNSSKIAEILIKDYS